MKTLQIRVPDELRADANEVLEEMGLDLPTAIRLYLTKIVQTRSIPFALRAEKMRVEEISVDRNIQDKMDSVASAWSKAKKH